MSGYVGYVRCVSVSDGPPPFATEAMTIAAAGPLVALMGETGITVALVAVTAVGAMVAAVGGPGGTSVTLAENLHLILVT